MHKYSEHMGMGRNFILPRKSRKPSRRRQSQHRVSKDGWRFAGQISRGRHSSQREQHVQSCKRVRAQHIQGVSATQHEGYDGIVWLERGRRAKYVTRRLARPADDNHQAPLSPGSTIQILPHKQRRATAVLEAREEFCQICSLAGSLK